MNRTPADAWQEIRDMLNLSELARKLDISRAAVSAWEHVPSDRVEDVSRHTRIPVGRLRPDMFPDTMPWQNKT